MIDQTKSMQRNQIIMIEVSHLTWEIKHWYKLCLFVVSNCYFIYISLLNKLENHWCLYECMPFFQRNAGSNLVRHWWSDPELLKYLYLE